MGASAAIFPGPAYCAAKVPTTAISHFRELANASWLQGAVVNLTREMGLQYAKQGITVNALCPGTHRTDMVDALGEAGLNALKGYSPMGRLAEASDIKGPAIYLASSASNFMTGQTLVVDGGCLAGPGMHMG